MKAIKLLTASALLAGLAALTFAGPSPQFSGAQTQKQQVQPAKVIKVCANCVSCACCSMNK